MWKKIKDLIKKNKPSSSFIKGVGSTVDIFPKKKYSVKNKTYEEIKKEITINATLSGIGNKNRCSEIAANNRRNSLSDYSGIKRWDHEENIEEFLYPKEDK